MRMPDRPAATIALAAALLGGCAQLGDIQLGDIWHTADPAEALDTLLEQHEYARVRQLTGRYPSLDSPGMQERIEAQEKQYEQQVLVEARTHQDDGNLYQAVQLLSAALEKVPHSSELRELRNRLEQQRVDLLEVNEQHARIARARYLLEQRSLYSENIRLAPPGHDQQAAHRRNEEEALRLSEMLRKHADRALQRDDIASARQCLKLSRKLHDTEDAVALESRLAVIDQSNRQIYRKKASIKQARIRHKQTQDDRQQTGQLTVQVDTALQENRLQDARTAFERIPDSMHSDENVFELRKRLQQAIGSRVKTLLSDGDSLYRADRVKEALATWQKARALDPDNSDIHERIERAGKVLAKLEELKQLQKK